MNEYIQKVADVWKKILRKHIAEIETWCLNAESDLDIIPMAEEFLTEIAEETRKVSERIESPKRTPVIYSMGYLKKQQACVNCQEMTNTAILDHEHQRMIPSCMKCLNLVISKIED